MVITEDIINRRAMDFVEEIASSVWEDDDSITKLAADLAYINAICEFSRGLKQVLKGENDNDE